MNSSILPNVNIKMGVPESERALIWKIFFEQRDRGINLNTHFPWINSSKDLYCISIDSVTAEGKLSTGACLIVKAISGSGKNYNGKVGLIGLVCVAEPLRGKGLSTLLLNESIKLAAQVGLESLVLWTQKPNVYTKHGFVIDDEEVFCVVDSRNTSYHQTKTGYITQPWLDIDKTEGKFGLPPFATMGKKISTDAASAIILETKSTPTIAEWAGSAPDVIDLLLAALPTHWGLNLNSLDDLHSELIKRNCEVQPMSKTFRLVKNLTDSAQLQNIKLLQRI